MTSYPSTSTDRQPADRALVYVLRIFCLIPFLTGLIGLLGGASFFSATGAVVSSEILKSQPVNNQIRFFSAIWIGYGLTLWWASNDIRARGTCFRISMGALLLGGMGRAFSVYQDGEAGVFFTGAMLAEAGGSVALLAWHTFVAGSARKAAAA